MPKISDIFMLYRPRQVILAINRQNVDPADFPKLISEGFARLGGHMQEHGALMTDLPYAAYIKGQDETIDLQIGVGIPYPVAGKEDIEVTAMPAGTVASCMYRGPYQGLAALYAEIEATAREWGFSASTGISYEYYFNGPPFAPEDFLTRVVVPLESDSQTADAGES